MVVPLMLDRPSAEANPAELVPFTNGDGYSGYVERRLDTRPTVSADPMDPEGGFCHFNGSVELRLRRPLGSIAAFSRQLAYDQDMR